MMKQAFNPGTRETEAGRFVSSGLLVRAVLTPELESDAGISLKIKASLAYMASFKPARAT